MEVQRLDLRLAVMRGTSDFMSRAAPAVEDFGDKGKRAYFWQDGCWQTGRAWSVNSDGSVSGMCRDYGDWSLPYPGREPMQTHGEWAASDVKWTRPRDQYQHADPSEEANRGRAEQ